MERRSRLNRQGNHSVITAKLQRTYCLIVPVVRALIIHCRSKVLKGISTRLVPLSRSLALSGYMMWWVVLVPTSSSNPEVGAWFILHGHERERVLFHIIMVAGCLAMCSSQPITLAEAGNWQVTSEAVPVGLGGREESWSCPAVWLASPAQVQVWAAASSSLETQNSTASLELDIFSPDLSGLKKTFADLLRVGCRVDDRDFGLFTRLYKQQLHTLELNKPLMALKKKKSWENICSTYKRKETKSRHTVKNWADEGEMWRRLSMQRKCFRTVKIRLICWRQGPSVWFGAT